MRSTECHSCLNCRTASSSVVLTLIGALAVTHAMLRRLTSWRCIIIIIIILVTIYDVLLLCTVMF